MRQLIVACAIVGAAVVGSLAVPSWAVPSTTLPSPSTVASMSSDVGDDAMRRIIAEVAAAQLGGADPAWQPAQRDCAGLVRFAYREAFKRLRPERLARPLFADDDGAPVDFADADTLIRHSFVNLGRNDSARRQLKTGDVLVYRQDRGDDDVVWHMMLAIVPAAGEARVIYHPGLPPPGEPDPGVRHGALRALTDDAPLAWRPVVDNPSFLGFYRFAEFDR